MGHQKEEVELLGAGQDWHEDLKSSPSCLGGHARQGRLSSGSAEPLQEPAAPQGAGSGQRAEHLCLLQAVWCHWLQEDFMNVFTSTGNQSFPGSADP